MLCFPLDNTEYEAEGLGLEHVTRSRGVFAADMKVELLNDGPVTIWLDTDELGITGDGAR